MSVAIAPHHNAHDPSQHSAEHRGQHQRSQHHRDQHRDTAPAARSLDAQRDAFSRRRFLAMPLAGLLVWAGIGIGSPFLGAYGKTMLIYFGTGCIVYLGMFLSRFTGENMLAKSQPKNPFDTLFLLTALMAILVYAIAIPFALVDHTSLPMTVGILTGLMWMPFSWIIQHWIGIAHTLLRTALIVTAWFLLPDLRHVAIPAIIVVLYLLTIAVLERRWRQLPRD